MGKMELCKWGKWGCANGENGAVQMGKNGAVQMGKMELCKWGNMERLPNIEHVVWQHVILACK
jgi:hypothetical protein